jgi:replicative DNA helicase
MITKEMEVENQILGAILIDLNAAYVCTDEITPNDFNGTQRRRLWCSGNRDSENK